MPWIDAYVPDSTSVPVDRPAYYRSEDGTRYLRIPPPSVLLAMEKFIAAERARRKQRNKEVKCVGGYMASDVMVERAHAQHIADAEWYALARAEAQERKEREERQ